MGLFEKLKNGLKNTKDALASKITGVINSFTKIDEDFFEELEETFGMLLLLFRGLGEYRGYLLEALLFGDARKESIARPGLRFPCKSLQQVLFCLGTFD